MLPKLIAESDRVQAAKENFKASVEDLKSAKSMYHPNVSITYGHNEESDRTPHRAVVQNPLPVTPTSRRHKSTHHC